MLKPRKNKILRTTQKSTEKVENKRFPEGEQIHRGEMEMALRGTKSSTAEKMSLILCNDARKESRKKSKNQVKEERQQGGQQVKITEYNTAGLPESQLATPVQLPPTGKV